MTSKQDLASTLVGVEPCHFPSLADGPEKVNSGHTTEVCSMRMSISRDSSLQVDHVLQVAFSLLLKAYIGTDSPCFGFVTTSRSARRDTAAYLLITEVNQDFTPSNTIENCKTVPLAGPDGEIVGHAFGNHENEAGFRFFNTTLYLDDLGQSPGAVQNHLGSDIVLAVTYKNSTEQFPGDCDHYVLELSLHYNTNVLDETRAHDVLATYENLVSSITKNHRPPLGSLNLISPRDEQIIREWNATVPPSANQTLNEHFEKVFRDNATKEAVFASDGTFTYKQLDDLSTILARRLAEAGVHRNVVVPICMDKSKWGTVAMASVWKAGGAVSTMDPSYPDDRIFATIKELDASLVIVDKRHASRFRNAGMSLRVITDLEDLSSLEQDSTSNQNATAWRAAGVKPDDLAFVAFTSGSSGTPKGVMHSHDRLTSEHLSYGWNAEYSHDGGARVLQFGSYAFIAGVGDNFRTLLHSGTLCVPSETERTSDLAGFIRRSRASRAYLTPSVLRTLKPEHVPTLRYICVGGEPIGRDLEEEWAGHVIFIHLYGASEGGFMIKEPTNPTYHGKGLYPVGGCAWLVDPKDVNKLVPIGALGEIIFESRELALGYLNDEKKTATTFIEPPLWARRFNRETAHGCRYLRMGDLGRHEKDGSISIYGRADTQVKIYGQRVELGDVESHLRAVLPPHSQVVVDLVKPFDAPERPLLTAFCRIVSLPESDGNRESKDDHASITRRALDSLESRLPRHMIPKAFIILEKLPQAYKTDRKKLRSDASSLGYQYLAASVGAVRAGSLDSQERPATDKEVVLSQLWAKFLGKDVKDIRLSDNFFGLGGDSLVAIKMVSAAREQSLELTTQAVLAHPVLQEMAEVAKVETSTDKWEVISSHDASGTVSEDVPTLVATDFQEWAALVGSLNGGWVDHFIYDICGTVDVERLERSCQRLVEFNPILRTVFNVVQGRVHMRVMSKDDVHRAPFVIHHVTSQDTSIDEQSKEICNKDRKVPLGQPIVRFDLLRASTIRHRLIFRISHAQYDGFCASTFTQHLRMLYCSPSHPLPPVVPFHEYIRKIQDPTLVRDSEAYWTAKLRGSHMPNIVRQSQPVVSTLARTNTLDSEFHISVPEPDLRQHGLSVATVVKTAWALTISALSGSADVVFGDFVSGRQVPIPGIETVVGPCVNFMPVRARISSEQSNRLLMETMQKDLVESIPHESLGFAHIIKHCTDWGYGARYSSIVNFVNVGTSSCDTEVWECSDSNGTEKLEVQSSYEEQQHDKTDLWLLCKPENQVLKNHLQGGDFEHKKKSLDLFLRYSSRVYDLGAIERIGSLYCEVLAALTMDPEKLAVIPKFEEHERSLLVPVLS